MLAALVLALPLESYLPFLPAGGNFIAYGLLVLLLMGTTVLAQGYTYDEVVAHTGASTATISRVKRCLNYGADGYTLVLKNGCLSVNADGGDTDEC